MWCSDHAGSMGNDALWILPHKYDGICCGKLHLCLFFASLKSLYLAKRCTCEKKALDLMASVMPGNSITVFTFSCLEEIIGKFAFLISFVWLKRFIFGSGAAVFDEHGLTASGCKLLDWLRDSIRFSSIGNYFKNNYVSWYNINWEEK